VKKTFAIQGGQQLVVVVNDGEVVLRIQKYGHNRGIAKLAADQAAAIAELMTRGAQ
jgi:hypothetical protein